jgi:hypothetical protein
VFRIVLIDVRRLSPEETNDVGQSVDEARASFEALDPTTTERLARFDPLSLPAGRDLAVYTVVEEHGRTSEHRDVIAPMNEELAPGSEVALDGTISTLFREGSKEVSLNFAERVVAADWKTFWSQAPDGPAA